MTPPLNSYTTLSVQGTDNEGTTVTEEKAAHNEAVRGSADGRARVVIAAAPKVRDLIAAHLIAAGMAPSFINWSLDAPSPSVFPPGTKALIVSALRLKLPTKQLAALLNSFPRRAAEAARAAGVERIIFAVPEVRSLPDETATALRSSVIMMQRSFKAVILRTGLLLGCGGIIEGYRIGPKILIGGQGWGEVCPVNPQDFANSLVSSVNMAQEEAEEKTDEGMQMKMLAVASSSEFLPLADFVQLHRGGVLRIHVPVSLLALVQYFSGASLEERALFGRGSLKLERNDLKKLTGKEPEPLSSFAQGKVPKWLAHLASSQ